MKRIGLYPGSFNPWHKGHEDVSKKALKIFDEIIIAIYSDNPHRLKIYNKCKNVFRLPYKNIKIIFFYNCFLKDIAFKYDATAIIRGLRNGADLQYEINLQYWNEDLGLKIPTVYFITDRTLAHISSSALREIEEIKRNTK